MRKHLVHIAATLTILVAVGITASAQITRTMTVKVPFDFHIGKTALPAGTYTVYNTSTQSGDGFLMRDINGGAKVFFVALPVKAGKTRSVARLDFRRYNDKFFLARVWSAGSNIGRELQQSGLERDVAKTGDRNVAYNESKPEIVTIASE